MLGAGAEGIFFLVQFEELKNWAWSILLTQAHRAGKAAGTGWCNTRPAGRDAKEHSRIARPKKIHALSSRPVKPGKFAFPSHPEIVKAVRVTVVLGQLVKRICQDGPGSLVIASFLRSPESRGPSPYSHVRTAPSTSGRPVSFVLVARRCDGVHGRQGDVCRYSGVHLEFGRVPGSEHRNRHAVCPPLALLRIAYTDQSASVFGTTPPLLESPSRQTYQKSKSHMSPSSAPSRASSRVCTNASPPPSARTILRPNSPSPSVSLPRTTPPTLPWKE